jgi:hypothetical protein
MIATIPWVAVSLGLSTLACIALAVWVLVDLRARSTPLSRDERKERAGLPMTPLQKAAWWGVLIGLIQAALILGLFRTRGGAAGYWEDHGMRMLVLALFLIVVFTFTALKAFVRSKTDERDRPVLSWAATVQSTVVFLTLAAWTTILPKLYHEDGAIPVVYCYLILGSIFIVHMLSYPLGILRGCWGLKHHGQG